MLQFERRLPIPTYRRRYFIIGNKMTHDRVLDGREGESLQRDREEELRTWVEAYADKLTHLAYTYVRDWGRAEDAVQETFIKAYGSRAQLQHRERPFPWLVRILINECHSAHRRRKREAVSVDWMEQVDVAEQNGMSAEEQYLRKCESLRTYREIMDLPDIFRTPIVLYYVHGLSTREIAEALGIHAVTARTRLTRARRRLKQNLRRCVEDEIGEKDSRFHSTLHDPSRG